MRALLTLGLVVAEFILLALLLPALAPVRPQPRGYFLVWLVAVIVLPLPLIGIFALWTNRRSDSTD